MRVLRRAIDRRRRRVSARKASKHCARNRSGKTALASLAASLLALPGLAAPASADAPTAGVSTDYSFSYYAEHDLPGSKVTPGGETQRYEIQSHQLSTRIPLFERFQVGVDVIHESMSGASPWYVVPDADGNPVEVMTGATIEDARTDVTANTSYFLDSGRAGLSGGVSWEKDYLAFNGGINGERQLNEGNTTILTGGGLSLDTLRPTDSESDPFRPNEETRQSYTLYAGVSQVIGKNAVIQSTLNYQHSRGYLSDPYKRVLVEGEPVADRRPDSRNQFSLLTRLRHHFETTESTVHVDYRFHLDDWELQSHTVEFAWYQTLWRAFRLIPSFRYYSQSQAEFYGPFFPVAPSDGHFSSDYRLSPFGALSFRLRAEAAFDLWQVGLRATVGWERYLSSGDFALGKVQVASPGLVDFDLFTVGLQTRF